MSPIDKMQPITKQINNIQESKILIQVSPNIYQSQEDLEANQKYDEARDNSLTDVPSDNVY